MASILQVKINNSWVSIPALQGNKGPTPEYTIDYWTRSDKDDIIARILGARQLAAPTIQLEDTLLIIEPVENATTYDIYINGEYINTRNLVAVRDDDVETFKVDSDGNLFYSNFELNNEIFIDSNVSHVSSAYGNNKLIFCAIKNGKCYVYEIDNENISSPEVLKNINILASKTCLKFNAFNKKFYIIVSDENENNFISESIVETEVSHPYINAKYTISYETY